MDTNYKNRGKRRHRQRTSFLGFAASLYRRYWLSFKKDVPLLGMSQFSHIQLSCCSPGDRKILQSSTWSIFYIVTNFEYVVVY